MIKIQVVIKFFFQNHDFQLTDSKSNMNLAHCARRQNCKFLGERGYRLHLAESRLDSFGSAAQYMFYIHKHKWPYLFDLYSLYFLRFGKVRNASPQSAVTRSLGSFLRMTTKRPVSMKGLPRQLCHGPWPFSHGPWQSLFGVALWLEQDVSSSSAGNSRATE